MTKFCDLNLRTNQTDCNLYEKLKTAINLGYHVLALSQIVDFSENACPTQENGLKQRAGKKKQKTHLPKENLIPSPIEIDRAKLIAYCTTSQGEELPIKLPETLQILNRCTMVMDSVDQLRFLKNNRAQKYDIIAVTPLNQTVFQACCDSAPPDMDILSLDTTQAWPIKFKRTNIHSLILKGAYVEFNYAPAITSSYARRNLIAQCYMMNCLGRGKNIIMCSGAEKALELRGPYDISNLGALFGFAQKQCHQLNTTRCEAVLKHAGVRKFSKYGVTVTNEKSILEPDVSKDLSGEQIVLDVLLKEEKEFEDFDCNETIDEVDVLEKCDILGGKRKFEEIRKEVLEISEETTTLYNFD